MYKEQEEEREDEGRAFSTMRSRQNLRYILAVERLQLSHSERRTETEREGGEEREGERLSRVRLCVQCLFYA